MSKDDDVVDLTNNSEDEPHSKRHKSSPHTPQNTCFYDPPMNLFRVRSGIPDWANEGFLGITLSKIIPPGIKYALISNYMIDVPWLLSAVPSLLAAEKLLILHGQKDVSAANITQHIHSAGLLEPTGRTTIHAPPLPLSYGVHHSKVFIVQYDRGLRVIIHTANLIYCDCNNKSQALYYQDFPRKDTLSPQTSEFENDLLAYVNKLSLTSQSATHLVSLIKQHDFSAARAKLVASVPGYHKGNELYSWGHLRLKSCLNRARGGFGEHFIGAPIISQFSSLGSLTEKWLQDEFLVSCSAGNSDGRKLGLPSKKGPEGFHIVWPTVSEVQNSMEGWFAGGSIPGPIKNVTKDFLLPYYHRWGGEPVGRQRAMPHIKTFCRYNENSKHIAWMLVTSHNLSKAAFGELQKNGEQLAIRHYELGALFLPALEVAYLNHRWRGFDCTLATETNSSVETHSNNNTTTIANVAFYQWQRGQSQHTEVLPDGTARVPLPVPYTLPPTKYKKDGSERDVPWCVDGVFSGIDSYGRTIHNPRGFQYGLLDDMEWADIDD